MEIAQQTVVAQVVMIRMVPKGSYGLYLIISLHLVKVSVTSEHV